MVLWINKDIHQSNTPEIKDDDFFDQMKKLCLLNFPKKDHKQILSIITTLRKQEKKNVIITWSQSEQLKFINKILTQKQLKKLKNEIFREIFRLKDENSGIRPFPNAKPSIAEKKVPINTFPGWKIKDRKWNTIKMKTKWEDITLLEDSGLYFYKVTKWDSISSIENKLQKYFGKKFSHLTQEEVRNKLKWFNIPWRILRPGLLIPIPWDNEDRLISDKQFTNSCHEWINMIYKNDHYGKYVWAILDVMLEQELIWLMLAVAKQESWWLPLGQFEFHRYEPHKKAFSFSIFHILMKGPWLKARQTLWHTEWQMYNPVIASKIFLWFIIEKLTNWKDIPVDIFKKNFKKIFWDIKEKTSPKDFEKFALFYNWWNWRKTNPNYAINMSRYYNQSQWLLQLAQL